MIRKKTINIMSAVFNVEAASINDKSGPDTIESWDSLKLMNLVSALEEEFELEFEDEEIVDMLSCEIIVDIIQERLLLK